MNGWSTREQERHRRPRAIGSREEALARMKRTEYQLEAASWLARSLGFTSREAVLCSVSGGRILSTPADGGTSVQHLIHGDEMALAMSIHLRWCGAPVFPTSEAQNRYHDELERALQAGLTPVPARDAALAAVGWPRTAAGRHLHPAG